MKSVLIVETDENIRETLCIIVRALGIGCDSVESSKRAFHKLMLSPPDILLLDLSPHDVEAKELIRFSSLNYSQTKIIVISAMLSSQVETILKDFQHVQYIKKPFNLDEIEKNLLT